MREIALHILDLAENSVSAGASIITITIIEDLLRNQLSIKIEDDGKGMDQETVARVIDPFVTSRTTRKVGLGIPLLKAAAEGCNGHFEITSELGVGTAIMIEFEYDHIDRMPLGNVADTFLNLLIAHPENHWVFNYTNIQKSNEMHEFNFDDQPVKELLGDIPLTEPSVLSYLKNLFSEGFLEQSVYL